MGLRISFFASSLVSAYWNGAATYYRGLLRALAARGHVIRFFEPDAYERQRHRDIPDPPWAQVRVWPATDAGLAQALEEGADADLVVKASGVGVYDAELEAAVAGLRAPGRSVIFWDVDAPATLERMAADPADPLRALLPAYDLVCTYGGGPPVVHAYLAAGARTCVPVYNALDPDTHHPVPPDARFEADLAFLGNRLPDREARVAEFFLRPAAARPQGRFLLGGSGWRDLALPPAVRYLGHVYTRDHNALNATARAVLNVSRASMARFGYSPATRVFEAAGAGACLLSDAWEGIETFLEPGREILVARDGEEVGALLDGLEAARARRIGAAALARVRAEHTYARRAAQVEALLEGREGPRSAS
jgi:spore maturation protein CgeB